MMNKRVKKRWVEALESGKYRQGQSQFCQLDGSKHARYCCLGVLNKIEKLGYPNPSGAFSYTRLPAGLTDDEQWDLIRMNDDGASFKEIAKYIKENL